MTTASSADLAASFAGLRAEVDGILAAFLETIDEELRAESPAVSPLVGEIGRVIAAGGSRMRPAFCYWGHRATGGRDGTPILRAAAALELLHTMALIHDDLMDEAATRRGVPTVQAHLASTGAPGDRASRDRAAASCAILVGDLAAVLADRLFLEAGFDPGVTVDALARYHRMRQSMAAGQYLDVTGLAGHDEATARWAAVLKGGTYSVEGPLAIGAALAGATAPQLAALARFGAPLGEAFQLRDDLRDGEGVHGATPDRVNALIDRARRELDSGVLDPDAVRALLAMADLLVMS
jgi:geranylgeranyl diphosphate synthase, type I